VAKGQYRQTSDIENKRDRGKRFIS